VLVEQRRPLRGHQRTEPAPVLRLPPLFDHVSVVLAWPEIGFPETVPDLSLPDRATVERGTVSIWYAPLAARLAPESLNHRTGALLFEELAVEAGRVVAMPQVLSRGDDAAVVLTRLTAVGGVLSMEILSVADGTWRPPWPPARAHPSRRCTTATRSGSGRVQLRPRAGATHSGPPPSTS
jgi:hypothetical protein